MAVNQALYGPPLGDTSLPSGETADIIVTDAETAITSNAQTVTHRTTGTAAAGLGVGIAYKVEDGAGNDQNTVVVRAVLTTVTNNSEVGAYRIAVIDAGTVPAEGQEQLQVTPAGTTILVSNAATNTITNAHTVRHRTSGTPAAGVGVSVTYATEDAGGADQDIAIVRYSLTTATAGAEIGAVRIGIVSSGSVPAAGSEQFQFTPTGLGIGVAPSEIIHAKDSSGETEITAESSASGAGATAGLKMVNNAGVNAFIHLRSDNAGATGGASAVNLGTSVSGGPVNVYAANAISLTVEGSAADGETAILIRRDVGGTESVVRVSMGAADSGGAGFKVLRVPN